MWRLTSRVLPLALLLLGGCGVETYRERAPSPELSLRLVAPEGDADAELLERASSGDALLVRRAPIVSASHIRRVRLLDSAEGARVLVLEVDERGLVRLTEASRAHVGGRIAVVVGGRVVAAPTIRGPLTEPEVYVAVPPTDVEAAFDALTVAPPDAR